jgi:hypothetical protein
MHILILLMVAHFLCDYPLQGDFLARAKNPHTSMPGVSWQQAMFAHAAIHAGAVYLITGMWWWALAELVLHAFIDLDKCAGHISFNKDQAFHLSLKVLYASCIALGWS